VRVTAYLGVEGGDDGGGGGVDETGANDR